MSGENGSTKATAVVQWKLSLPEGSTVKLPEKESSAARGITWLASGLKLAILGGKDKLVGFFHRAWKLGVNDPRKVIHGLKVGLALTLVSLFYYTRKLYDGVGGTSMWAVMTVIVVLEFTVGGTLYKGLNRMSATTSAIILALGVHYATSKVDSDTVELVILGMFIFILGAGATFSRFIPNVKARFDYGITIFILTLCLIAISGYRVEDLLEMAMQRILTIVIGCSICFSVSMLVHPVWAGVELHNIIISNMEKLAMSLEGYTANFFSVSSDGCTKHSTVAQVYKCILNSKALEDSMANFAKWEPAHGRFGFRQTWKHYLNVGAALRSISCCMETLHATKISDNFIQKLVQNQLVVPCMQLSFDTSNVLKEMSESIKLMTKSSKIDSLVCQMNHSVEDLKNAMQSFPLQSGFLREKPSVSSTDVLSFATFASMLIEVSSRVQIVTGTVNALGNISCFKDATAVDSELFSDVKVIVDKD